MLDRNNFLPHPGFHPSEPFSQLDQILAKPEDEPWALTLKTDILRGEQQQ